jgi:hypothetical protein
LIVGNQLLYKQSFFGILVIITRVRPNKTGNFLTVL